MLEWTSRVFAEEFAWVILYSLINFHLISIKMAAWSLKINRCEIGRLGASPASPECKIGCFLLLFIAFYCFLLLFIAAPDSHFAAAAVHGEVSGTFNGFWLGHNTSTAQRGGMVKTQQLQNKT